MQWLTQTLVASLYPGAPYERKYLAVLLLDTLLEVWNSPDAGCKSYIRLAASEQSLPASNAGLLVVGQHRFKAFCDGFFEAKTTRLLLGKCITHLHWTCFGSAVSTATANKFQTGSSSAAVSAVQLTWLAFVFLMVLRSIDDKVGFTCVLEMIVACKFDSFSSTV